MVRSLLSRLRDWIAVEDADERLEGSGEAITSPQHRRSPEAERTLEEAKKRADERRNEER
ncbi:hypothetical protein EA462_00645 [Natrarchaeobius halalkaliphilus]|uniref:Uncharacterized protein n=1 Tax=Natrarchaeobius halalkaliphilus TaxID=1679091 RepID=A0A3N6N3Q5_9EURY|nr:hypothetical protein [Natrarchaeobius halalkaliphilus]RQG92772.1 hypothetical protein EA462_00645 [Natrarchaeobius halalkaliphilus]